MIADFETETVKRCAASTRVAKQIFVAKEISGRQQRIHRAGTEALKIESDELKTQRLEDDAELCGHGRVERARKFVARNLNANNLSMMAHPELAEAESTNGVLALFHDRECFARNRP